MDNKKQIEKMQIDEMRHLADEMQKAISDEYRHRVLADERKLEEVLKENGWRKASEVAKEIFEGIDKILEVDKFGEAKFDIRELYELKKKYESEDTK